MREGEGKDGKKVSKKVVGGGGPIEPPPLTPCPLTASRLPKVIVDSIPSPSPPPCAASRLPKGSSVIIETTRTPLPMINLEHLDTDW